MLSLEKQAGSRLVSRVSSTCCFGPLLRKTTWVGSGFSDGSHLETRDISGSCCVTSPGSRVGIAELMLLVPQCYSFGTVLDFFKWLVSRRESSGPASRSALRVLEGELQEQEESSGAQERGRAHAGALF